MSSCDVSQYSVDASASYVDETQSQIVQLVPEVPVVLLTPIPGYCQESISQTSTVSNVHLAAPSSSAVFAATPMQITSANILPPTNVVTPTIILPSPPLYSYNLRNSLGPTPSVYVTQTGIISAYLNWNITVELTLDKVVRVINNNNGSLCAVNNNAHCSLIWHPAGKIVQDGVRIEAEVTFLNSAITFLFMTETKSG